MTSPPYWGLRDYGHDEQLGLEETPERYVENLMQVFNELKRVLKPTGTFYLNIDDTYNSKSGADRHSESSKISSSAQTGQGSVSHEAVKEMPEKCMSMVPERVMMAMVDNGWILRNKIVWNKPNPMPESVKDRFSTTWEYVYMFSLEQKYYFDLDAVREPHSESSKKRLQQNNGNPNFNPNTKARNPNGEQNLEVDDLCHSEGKNPGDTWEITTKGFSEAHFAVYPPELCEKPVKAGCPKKVCKKCGKPYERITEEEVINERDREEGEWADKEPAGTINSGLRHKYKQKKRETVGFESTCDCPTDKTEKGVILDSFAGAGTTGLVARKHNRDYIGIELNEEYAEMAENRIKDEIGGQPLDQFV